MAETWEKVDTPKWLGPPFGAKALRISVDGTRFFEREMPEGLIDEILANRQLAAKAALADEIRGAWVPGGFVFNFAGWIARYDALDPASTQEGR